MVDRQTDRKRRRQMNINVLAKHGTARYEIQCDSYRAEKHFPRTYKAMMDWVYSRAQRYHVPLPVAAFEEDYDWGGSEDYTGVMLVSFFVRGDFGMELLESVVLQDANVYVMNETGATTNRLQI
jgi:hypothetical protein